MAKKTALVSASSPAKVEQLRTDDLYLDAKNPRLFGPTGKTDQTQLLRALWTNGALDELALSIAANGYFTEEPLFGVREGGKVVIVEGNRRLAAVKILRDQSLQQTLKATDVPQLTARERADLDTLPVSVYPNRKSLWAYVGFRHVNGPMTWDSWSKAQYIAQVHNEFGVDLDEIAERIGDKNQTVKRLYRGLMVLEQAANQANYSLDDRAKAHLSFSHLYTGLDYAGFQQHLGLPKDGGYQPNPVSRKNIGHLRELMVWLFGSKQYDIPPVVRTQNPDLKKLDEILKEPKALTALRSGLGLDVSYQISMGESARFRELLTHAKYDLQQAKGLVLEGYRGEVDLLDAITRICELAASLRSDMESAGSPTGKKRSRS